MDIIFDNENIKQIYKTGKTEERKYQKYITPSLAKSIVKTINKLESKAKMNDLNNDAGLNYEIIEDVESIRLDKKYRLHIQVSTSENRTILEVCNIIDISNHNKIIG